MLFHRKAASSRDAAPIKHDQIVSLDEGNFSALADTSDAVIAIST
jgi:hypothetical protein